MKFTDLEVLNMVKKMKADQDYRFSVAMTGLDPDVFSDFAVSAAEILNFIYGCDRRIGVRVDGPFITVHVTSKNGESWEH